MKTTFGRTICTTVIILLAALLLLGTSFQASVKEYLTETVVTNLEDNATALADLASAYYSEGSLLSQQDFMVNLDVVSRITNADAVICDTSGKVILCSNSIIGCDHHNLHIDLDYLNKVYENQGDRATGLIPGLYDESRFVTTMPIYDHDTGEALGIVMVSQPVENANIILRRIAQTFMIISILVVSMSVITMIIVVRRQNEPLREMATVARSFGHGDLDARVHLKEDYPEEVEDLAVAFNNMAQELQKSEYQRKEFVANVSHELKTPMTTISGYVDGILDGTIPPQRHRQYLQIVSDETKRLSRLVRSMLDISRLQSTGIPEENKIHFDMEEALGQVLITFEQKITSKKLNVEVDMPDHPVYTIACQDQVTQVIYNLIDNGVKFCPVGGTLSLAIKEGDNKIYTSVANEGETIPQDELPLVFDRFHKMDKSRSQNRDGWGLGLYIVKTIVCSHGENISVTSRDGMTTFTFTMPLVN